MTELQAGKGIEIDQEGGVGTPVSVKINDVFGSILITSDLTNGISLVGIGNTDFVDDTGFVPVTGFSAGESNGMTFQSSTNYLILPVDGQYYADGYVSGHSSVQNDTVALKFSFNGSTLSPRPILSKMPSSGDQSNLAGSGTFYATAGTVLGVKVASDRNSVFTAQNSSLTVRLMRAFTR